MSEQFGYRGNGSPEGVNQELLGLVKMIAEDFPLRVRVLSGRKGRNSGAHSKGIAIDVTIYCENGYPLPNYQNPRAYRVYEMFAQFMYHKARQHYPHLVDGNFSGNWELQWGGLFGDDFNGGYKYGSHDLMDFRLQQQDVTRAGGIVSGLQGKYKGWYDRDDLLGGSKPFESIAQLREDMEVLYDFRLTEEEFEDVKEDGFFGVAKASGTLPRRRRGMLSKDEKKTPTSPSPRQETDDTVSHVLRALQALFRILSRIFR